MRVYQHKDLPALEPSARRQTVDELRRIELYLSGVTSSALGDCPDADGRIPQYDCAARVFAPSAMQQVEGPEAIPDLELQAHAVFRNDSGEAQGGVGPLLDEAGVYIARVPEGTSYDPSDGGIALRPGAADIYGSVVTVKTFEDATIDIVRDVQVDKWGHLLAVDPPPPPNPPWTDTSAHDADLPVGTWYEIPDLIITTDRIIEQGKQITGTLNIDVLHVSGGGGTLDVGFGLDGAVPDSHNSYVIPSGFDGYVASNVNTLASAQLPIGTTISGWVRANAGSAQPVAVTRQITNSVGNPGPGDAWDTGAQIRVHYLAADASSQEDELKTVEAGWSYAYTTVSGTVIGVNQRAGDVRFDKSDTAQGPEATDVITFTPLFALELTGSTSAHELIVSVNEDSVGGGTTDHQELSNRSALNSHPALSITYDPQGDPLTLQDDVQEAMADHAYTINDIRNQLNALRVQLWPKVGDLWTTTTDEQPGVRFPGTTWVAYAKGEVLVGAGFHVPSGETYLRGATGGSAEITLTEGQLPAHNHPFQAEAQLAGQGPGSHIRASLTSGTYDTDVIGNTGSGDSVDVRQPYIVVNVWQRTA